MLWHVRPSSFLCHSSPWSKFNILHVVRGNSYNPQRDPCNATDLFRMSETKADTTRGNPEAAYWDGELKWIWVLVASQVTKRKRSGERKLFVAMPIMTRGARSTVLEFHLTAVCSGRSRKRSVSSTTNNKMTTGWREYLGHASSFCSQAESNLVQVSARRLPTFGNFACKTLIIFVSPNNCLWHLSRVLLIASSHTRLVCSFALLHTLEGTTWAKITRAFDALPATYLLKLAGC